MNTATATRPNTREQEFAQPAGNVPATREQSRPANPIVQFKGYMDARVDQLQFALPPNITPERFTRVVLTALQRKPELLRCTPQSLWNACLLAAHDGLLPDGREGAIAPYGENENGQRTKEIATWMPMIEGLRKKARNSGEIADWNAQVVREKDHFRFRLGDDPYIEHEPYYLGGDPGEVIAAYSIALLKDGTKSREVMTRWDIDKIRAKSKAARGPWSDPTFFPEMARKTVARRHYKQLPHSSDLDAIFARDDEAFGLDERNEAVIEQRQARRVATTTAALDTFAAGAAAMIEHEGNAGDPEEGREEANAGEAAATGRAQETGKAEGAAAETPTSGRGKAAPRDDGERTRKPRERRREEPAAGDDQSGQARGGDQQHAQEAAPPRQDRDQRQEGGRSEMADDGRDAAGHDDLGAGDDLGGAQDVGLGDEEWPNGRVPKNTEEYIAYFRRKLSTEADADKLAVWWNSSDERRLRGKCSVMGDVFDNLLADVKDRVSELRRQTRG